LFSAECGPRCVHLAELAQRVAVVNDVDSRGKPDAHREHSCKRTDDPGGLAECHEDNETDPGDEKRNKEADTYGATPKCEDCLAQQRRTIDECGLVGHGGYRFTRSARARERLGLPLHNGLVRCSACSAALSCPQSTNLKGLNATANDSTSAMRSSRPTRVYERANQPSQLVATISSRLFITRPPGRISYQGSGRRFCRSDSMMQSPAMIPSVCLNCPDVIDVSQQGCGKEVPEGVTVRSMRY